MSRRQTKKEIFHLLKNSELDKIYQKLKSYSETVVVNTLFMALCDGAERIRWHAVSCFGEIVSDLAQSDLEKARVIMRRLLWSLNDESGGIGWGAPEAMAEIMVRSTPIRKEYLHMLISYMQEDGDELFQDGNFLELPMLQKGLLWGIGRLCHSFPVEMEEKGVADELIKYLCSSDVEIKNLAIWALAGIIATLSDEVVNSIDNASGIQRIYLDGGFFEIDLRAM